ncbi:MAG: CsgG/HfaB family protein [Candidatus Binatia bacterium]
MGKGHKAFSFVLLWLLGFSISGCAPQQPPITNPSPAPPPLPQRVWAGERAKVVVLEFASEATSAGKKKPPATDMIFATGMRAQLVKTLQQTGRFAVLVPARGGRGLQTNDFPTSGEIHPKIRQKLDSFDGAEFLIAGAVVTYQPSQASKAAGVAADPIFDNIHMEGRKLSSAIIERAFQWLPTATPDKVVLNVRLIEPQSGRTISSTSVTGTPQDFEHEIEGLFGQQLMTGTGILPTPMQKAVRACMIKTVNWIADTGLEYRRLAALTPPQPRTGSQEPRQPFITKHPQPEKDSVTNTQRQEVRKSKPEATTEGVAEKPILEKPIPSMEHENPPPQMEQEPVEEWGQ